MDKTLVGVDIGGSHLTASYVHPGKFKINGETKIRKQVDSLASKEVILSSWLSAFKQLDVLPHTRIGIAMPAPFDYENGIARLKEQGKFRSIYGVNLREYLADNLQLPKQSIAFFNDAASFLQGEALFQQIPPDQRLLGITLGTGLGSAYKTGTWAEDAALWSTTFKGQQAEYYLGTGWFVKWVKQEHNIEISGLKELLANPAWSEMAKQALEIFGTNLGEFLALHSMRKHIEKIVIGGNLSKASRYFSPAMRKAMNRQNCDVEIVFSQLGEHAALVGAASSIKC
jgi:glucokinase